MVFEEKQSCTILSGKAPKLIDKPLKRAGILTRSLLHFVYTNLSICFPHV